jgi:hypothetical protein
MAMENDWVIIASFVNELNCQLAVERLAQEDIESVVFDRRDSMYKIGEIDLFVHRDFVIKAKETIKDLV